MRNLISLSIRGIHRLQGVPEPQSCFHRIALRRNRDSSGAPSAMMALVVASLRNSLLFSALGGGGYWLQLQDWSTDGGLQSSGSGEAVQVPRQTSLLDLSWSADGRTVLSRSVGRPSGSPLLLHRLVEAGAVPLFTTRPIPTGKQFIWNSVLLPDASAVVVVDESRIVSRIDIGTGVRTDLLKITDLNNDRLAVASDGSCLAVTSDGQVGLFDPRSGEELLRLAGRTLYDAKLVFSDDRHWVATTIGNGTIRVWNRSTGEIVRDLTRHDGAVAAVRFVNGSGRLASVGLQPDATLRLWDFESGDQLWQVAEDRTGLRALAVSADGSLAATGGYDSQVVLWDLNERARLRVYSGHAGIIQALQFSPDGTLLTSASDDGMICIWDVGSTDLLHSIDVESFTGTTHAGS